MPRQILDEQVLEAAVDVMATHGYAGATTKQIAQAAGINEVTLFRRFGSKAKLLRAAMRKEFERFGGDDGVVFTGEVAADLEHIVRSYQGLLHRRGRLIPVILAELPRQPELREIIEMPLGLISSVAQLIAQYQKRGILVDDSPFGAAAALLAPLLMPALLGSSGLMSSAFRPVEPFEHVRAYLRGREIRE
ncbi:MAG: TetR/AcrR family transcriptional regulator [Proteobacteria bacterium]|nr:TetR/AcrR family transcriptional regulator [Pseudomonadota bacterium]